MASVMLARLLLLGVFVLPPIIFVGGFFAVMQFKRKIKLLVRKSEKEYLWKTPVVYGKRIQTKLAGKDVEWIIKTKPDAIHSVFGLIPFYYVECGKPTTSEINISKQQITTETELRAIENQSILTTLFKMDMLGKEGIAMLIGAVGVGAVLGIIISKLILFKQV